METINEFPSWKKEYIRDFVVVIQTKDDENLHEGRVYSLTKRKRIGGQSVA